MRRSRLYTAFPADRTRFVLSDIVTQGYQLPSSYPSLANGGIVNAAAVAARRRAGWPAFTDRTWVAATTRRCTSTGSPLRCSFASPGQFNVQVPWEASGFASFGMIVNGAPSNVQFASVNTYSPGVFLISNTQAAITHVDGSLVSTTNPATANETVVVYATGLGPVSGGMVTGKPASNTSLQPTTPQQATATIGGVPAVVSLFGIDSGIHGPVSGQRADSAERAAVLVADRHDRRSLVAAGTAGDQVTINRCRRRRRHR